MDSDLAPMPDDWQRGLAVAAHPDDLEWGSAAAIARWTAEGREFSYLLVTRGEAGIDGVPPEQAAPLREAEERASAAAVGVSAVDFLDHRDGVIEYGTALRRDIAATIRRQRPELVLTLNPHNRWPFGGWNSADHRAAGTAVLDGVADAGNRWIFGELDLEPWQVRYVAINGSPYPTHAVAVDDTVERAVESLSAHRAYLEALSDTPVPEQAREIVERGVNAAAPWFGNRPAVAFELL